MQKRVVVTDLKDAVGPIVNAMMGRSIVRLDGHPGSGKTTLGELLAKATGLQHIEVDRYIIKDRNGAYPECIDQAHLDTVLQGLNGKFIFESIWSLAIRPLNFAKPELSIWVEVKSDDAAVNRAYMRSAETLMTTEYVNLYHPKLTTELVVTRHTAAW